ncbi:hypothetical protein ABZP36_008720 [Zizania latifolia]
MSPPPPFLTALPAPPQVSPATRFTAEQKQRIARPTPPPTLLRRRSHGFVAPGVDVSALGLTGDDNHTAESDPACIPSSCVLRPGVPLCRAAPLAPYFKSSLDSHLLDLLWNKYWVNMLSSSLILESRAYVDGQIFDLADQLEKAEGLFTFADTYRGIAGDSYLKLQNYYNSTGYVDELPWAASWFYHATGDQTYLSYVTVQNGKAFADWGRPTWFSWDDKLAGTQVLLTRINFFGSKQTSNAENMGLKMYRDTVESVNCGLLPDSLSATGSRTGGGLMWISPWNSLQHATNAAFLVVVYSDCMLTSQTVAVQCSGEYYSPTDIHNFAISHANYILGDNPMKLSYLARYGSNYP